MDTYIHRQFYKELKKRLEINNNKTENQTYTIHKQVPME